MGTNIEGSFAKLWKRQQRRMRRGLAASLFGFWASLAGLLAAGAAFALWWRGSELWVAVPLLWIASLLAGCLMAWAASGRNRERRRKSLLELDRICRARAAFLATDALDRREAASRLEPLVREAADEAAARNGFRPPEEDARGMRWGMLLLGLFVLSILFAVLPRSEFGRLPLASGAGGGTQRGLRQPAAFPDPEIAGGVDSGSSPLAEAAGISIKTPERIYRPGEEIPLFIRASARAPLDEDLPLELLLVVGPKSFSAESLEGRGFLLRPALDVPAAGGPSAPRIEELGAFLEEAGVERGHEASVEVWARDATGRIEGVIRSNRIHLKLVDDHGKDTVPQQREAGPGSFDPERNPEADPPGDPSQEGEADPGLGAPKRLPGAELVAEAVRPLLGEGDSITKEVEVFSTPESGRAPPPGWKPPGIEVPEPAFEKRAEEMPGETPPGPAERVLLRRYWDAVRGRR